MTRTLVSLLMLALAACGGAQTGADEARADPLESIDAEELYRRGMLLARGGDYARAEQYLAASMDRGVDAERVVPALLAVCVEASRLAAALDYAEPYLEANPEQWSLRMLVASIRMGLGHHQEAREELERVLEDAPDEPQAYYFLGVLHRDAFDDADAAREHFRRYLALAPEGSHRAEARAALTSEERGVPQRVPMPETGDDETADEEAAPAEEEAATTPEEAAP
ncbi:MAG: tetratricopeptide repeat protein [Sandaracinaceae bacterium]